MRGAVAGLLVLGACGFDRPADVAAHDAAIDMGVTRDANPSLFEVALVPNNVNRDLDLLFVIDDSPSMYDKQTNLKASFETFVSALSSSELPNLHIGVISTDVGTMGEDDTVASNGIGAGPGSCAMGSGKNGNLQTNGSTLVMGTFISDIKDAGGTRALNYTGTLVDAFSSIASLGGSGCGFEQPFSAMRRALSSNPSNVGFVRDSARMAIIFLSDEDDCSMSHSEMLLGPDTATFGPLQSFRCTRFGVTCDVGGQTSDEMNVMGPKAGCHSNEQSPYIADVARYTTFLRNFKTDPRSLFVAAIVGNTSPFEVELRTPPGGGTAIPAVAHSCTYAGAMGAEYADPATRIEQLVASVERGSIASVCNTNLATPMSQLALQLKPLVGDNCLQQPIAQPAVCEAFDIDGSGGMVVLPACDAANTPPCFSLVADPALCPSGQGLKVEITRTAAVSTDTWTSVRCAL